jgi:4-diphosphocytidyl-2-C-methyl-D-erythritol kinase
MKRICIQAPAKLNLALDIVGKTDNGYHLMQMIMQTIDLSDTVELEQTDTASIELTCSRSSVPCDQRNICYQCAKLFFEKTGVQNKGLRIHIEKRIPQQAGMAGGSTDGAAVLVGLNHLCETGLNLSELCEIGVQIGADIPFCLIGGTAVVEGIGEQIHPIAPMPPCSIVVAKPKGGISTQKAFMEFDRRQIKPQLDLTKMIDAIESQDLSLTAECMYNAFEQVCTLEDVFTIRNLMKSCGAKSAIMTGSGSAVFGIFTDRKKAYQCERKLSQRYDECFLTDPISHGAQIIE